MPSNQTQRGGGSTRGKHTSQQTRKDTTEKDMDRESRQNQRSGGGSSSK